MTTYSARPFARVVRLADLDNLYEAPLVPAVSEPLRTPSGTLPDRAHSDSSNDASGSPWGRPEVARPASEPRGPQPIGSSLPGALPEAETPAPEPAATRQAGARPEPELGPELEPLPVRQGSDGSSPVRKLPKLPGREVLVLPFTFDGSGRAYARIWFGNLLLLLVTGGLAWPWTYRRSQRYFLHHTQVANHRMAFRLSARAMWPRLAMMLALWVGVAGAAAGSWRTGLVALTLGSIIWPLTSYLGLDQRVGSLSWGGRRLWFEGPWHGVYRAATVPLLFGVAAVWSAAAGLEGRDDVLLAAAGLLGLAWFLVLPLAVWRFLCYRQEHLRLGPLRLRWKAYRADVVSLLTRILAWTLLVGVASSVVAGLAGWAWQALRGDLSRTAALGLSLLAVAGTLVAVVPFVQASVLNQVWNKTGNRYLRVRSNLRVGAYVRLYGAQALRLLCTLGLYWPWAAVALRGERTRALALHSRVDPEVLRAYWSRRQSDAPPTLLSAMPEDAAAGALPQPRTGTEG